MKNSLKHQCSSKENESKYEYQMFESFGPRWAFQYAYDEEFLRIAQKWGWKEIK